MYQKFTLFCIFSFFTVTVALAQPITLALKEAAYTSTRAEWRAMKSLKMLRPDEKALVSILKQQPKQLVISLPLGAGIETVVFNKHLLKPLRVRLSKGVVEPVKLVQYRVENNTSVSAITLYWNGTSMSLAGMVTGKDGTTYNLATLLI